ncbi:AMP-binding protein [Variovorax paradoxus]|uniref:AMP-binding protein n=1 Tax=Variovorax paradoxus TaxID=34073 RepID=A0A5Q0M6E4_VARPD|nr:long-chain fatty acid--CoA ligase [Variovorax paradoxus]QFZ84012.1 AMP-binding protein [Variovorax paradoxus]
MDPVFPTHPGVIERPESPLHLDRQYARDGVPEQVHVPETSLFANLEMSARRFPAKPAIHFYGATLTYGALLQEVEHMAGYLQRVCGVERGDRVLLFSQNCPQFISAYFAILRADAVVVPVNAMLLEDELRHIVADSGAVAGFCAQELAGHLAPLVGTTSLRHVVVHAYGDALPADDAGFTVPDWLRERAHAEAGFAGGVRWQDAVAAQARPGPAMAGPDDLCMLPYTSGTTGAPKACMHTHRTAMSSVAGARLWRHTNAEAIFLASAPFFHLLGLQNCVNGVVYSGATVVLLPRWDRETAAELIERYRVTCWGAPPPMLVDFFAQPGIEARDLRCLVQVGGGGAAMPEGTARLMRERYGLTYSEGYGLTETASFLLANPLHRPKPGCLGVQTFGVDARIIDPETLKALPQGETGEIVVHGAQVMRGYWNQLEANAESFLVIDGKRFFRTGDLGCMDEDGYFAMRDRLKRMINASGYKVWPAEVEAMLHGHPAIQESCVIASRDERRGETVKAVVVLRADARDTNEADILAWCRETMASYKAPRLVAIVDRLPRSATGKVAWRELQDAEMRA